MTSTETTPALAVRNLTKRFGSEKGKQAVTAVDQVSFTVSTGTVVGLFGPNGAGKTTLMKTILGLFLPDYGGVELEGVNVHQYPREASHSVEAILGGARNIYWGLTVEENIRYFGAINGSDPETAIDRCEELVERFNLSSNRDDPVRTLSRGVKQKVSLATVLATDAPIILIDEPTLGLDFESSVTLQTELKRVLNEGERTVVLSSHDVNVIRNVCDRLIVMDEGAIAADTTVSDLAEAVDTSRYTVVVRHLTPDACFTLERTVPAAEYTIHDDRTELRFEADSTQFYSLMQTLEEAGVALLDVTTETCGVDRALTEISGAPD